MANHGCSERLADIVLSGCLENHRNSMATRLHTLNVTLPPAGEDRSYPIVIGQGLLADHAFFEALLGDRPAVVVSNSTIAPLYMARVRDALGKTRQVTEVILPDGEQHKTLTTLDQIFTAALNDRHERRSVFIALGGGVVGDITGFAAACFMRGADFVQLPTTLLAQVDSSVGGKTGVNHPAGKNMLGAFYQPLAVAIDIDTLHSLPAREFAAGIAEVIKYGCIYDVELFDWLVDVQPRLLARETAVLAEAIERCCTIKAQVVAEDEREGGVRAILNFGHTFGHAIEHVQGYGTWLHGEAVAAGMMLAARVSAKRGWINDAMVGKLATFLEAFKLPIKPPADMTAAVFLAAMQTDKKVAQGRIRFVLLEHAGRAGLYDDVTQAEIEAVLSG